MSLAWPSLSSCLEVVPEAIRLWKPEIAPQAMVMKSTGKSGWPLTMNPVKAGSVMSGRAAPMPTMDRMMIA